VYWDVPWAVALAGYASGRTDPALMVDVTVDSMGKWAATSPEFRIGICSSFPELQAAVEAALATCKPFPSIDYRLQVQSVQ